MSEITTPTNSRLVAFVGSYEDSPNPGGGGIFALEVSPDGAALTMLSHVTEPKQAGYLAHAPSLGILYAVDERKTDGRGPVGPAASVQAFAVNPRDASLHWLNSSITVGPYPTFLALDEARRIVVSANHGSFEHTERVVQTADGSWTTAYHYDDSTVVVYALEREGHVGPIRDVRVLSGHGQDPNDSLQASGHGQASAHAHCAVIDPSNRYLLVCDKGTDRIVVFRLGTKLEVASTCQMPQQTGPRHLAFDPVSKRAFVTLEFASELASFDFDATSGELRPLDRQPTVGHGYTGPNEPAEVRVHPRGNIVYVNNRGEDSVAWFRIGPDGGLARVGHVPLAKSIHPGLAARSFTFAPDGSFVLVADRPANLVRSYAVDAEDGSLQLLTEIHAPNPAFIAIVELQG